MKQDKAGTEIGTTCKNCGKKVDFKKELNKEGSCFDCAQSITDSCGIVSEFEQNICRHYSNKWLEELKKGKTAAKYTSKQPYTIPKKFYKDWKEACGR